MALWIISKFSVFYKKYLLSFYKMSIEKRKNICYNKITKEVQSNEKLTFSFFIFWSMVVALKEEKQKRKNQKQESSTMKFS